MRNFQRLLLILFLSSTMIACQPTVKDFHPDNDSLFKITFSYPDDWTWKEVIPYDEPPLNEELLPSERIEAENESVSIQVYESSEPHTKAREWVDKLSSDSVFTPLADTTFQIDGHNARWLTLSSVAYSAQGRLNAQHEVIYFFTEDRYYTIKLFLLESDINGRVHKDFKELIKTIKVLP